MSHVTDEQFLRNLADNLPLLNPLYEREARDVRIAADRLAALEALARRVVDVNTMSEWNRAGLADTARALLHKPSGPAV